MQFVGKKLDDVLEILKKSGKKIILKENNHNVCGDTKLVTNVTMHDDEIILTFSDFIFNLRK